MRRLTDLLHVGFGNFVVNERITGVRRPDSAPIQRLVRKARAEVGKRVIDVTTGRRTRAVLFMDDGSIILIAITPEAIAGRAAAARSPEPRRARASGD